MSVESVLSEILGVPCGNVEFKREGTSDCPYGTNEYVRGSIQHRLTFSTVDLIPFEKVYNDEKSFGSIRIYGVRHYGVMCHKYDTYLLKGEETSRIVRAIVDELV